MACLYTASEIVSRLRAEVERGKPLFVPNCGSGLTAKLQEMGGSDMIVVSGTSHWRLRGQGSLAALMPNSDINQIITNAAPDPATEALVETTLASLSASIPQPPSSPWPSLSSAAYVLLFRGVGDPRFC